jgi:hypothetical protein
MHIKGRGWMMGDRKGDRGSRKALHRMQSMSTYLVVTQVGVSVYNIWLKVDIWVTVVSLPVVKLVETCISQDQRIEVIRILDIQYQSQTVTYMHILV